MIPPTFHIGDEVLITGPSITGNDIHLGKRFKIECMYVNPSQHIQFEPYDGTYYPASSLQLVEPELKIGDYVEVIGPCAPIYGTRGDDPKIFEIKSIFENGLCNGDMCRPSYPATSLRKLTPDEIKQHTNKANTFTVKFKCDTSEFDKCLDKLADTTWKFQVNERLSAIEKRLDFIEKFQRDQAEYRRGMLWVAGP